MADISWFSSLLSIISFPFQLVEYIVNSALDVLLFQILQLGPYLPIHF